MTWGIWFWLGAIALAALVTLLCVRGFYRAAYGDRYQRGRDDEREAQIRARQAASPQLWHAPPPRMLPAPPPPSFPYDAYGDDDAVRVLGSWHPEAAGPPRYDQMPPGDLDDGPPTSEWARDLIAGIETWNAANLPGRDLPWAG